MRIENIRFPRISHIIFLYTCSMIGLIVMWATEYPLSSWSGTVLLWVATFSVVQFSMGTLQGWVLGRYLRRLDCIAQRLSIDLSELPRRPRSPKVKFLRVTYLLLVILSEVAVIFGGSLLITNALLPEFGLVGFSHPFVMISWGIAGVGLIGQVAWVGVTQYLVYTLDKVVIVRRQETKRQVRRLVWETQPVSDAFRSGRLPSRAY